MQMNLEVEDEEGLKEECYLVLLATRGAEGGEP
jgi:hypothetical protein